MEKELQLLKSASIEIKNLRRSNDIMAARLDMFDSCMALYKTTTYNSCGGMAPDITWEIDGFLDEIAKAKEYEQRIPMT